MTLRTLLRNLKKKKKALNLKLEDMRLKCKEVDLAKQPPIDYAKIKYLVKSFIT